MSDESCMFCGATTHYNHTQTCPNYGLYDANGFPIPAIDGSSRRQKMDQKVYFSISFDSIPLAEADTLRDEFMQRYKKISFSYSDPIGVDDE